MMTADGSRQALTAALEGMGLTAVFQPIFLMNGQCLGYEALSRFSNGCPPDVVWNYAEKMGVAMHLDGRAIQTALMASKGLTGKLFLNIRAAHLNAVKSLASFAPPEDIVWEVTESEVTAEAGIRGSEWLRSQGYALALDDAGMAWSTPERLRWLLPHIVKLDLGIVHRWAGGETTPLREWVAAARSIGAMVLAEGVEEWTWAEGLASEGVEAVQGYAFGRPAEAGQWLRSHVAGTIGLFS